MPFEITFDDLPNGFAITPAKPGEAAKVCVRELVSSEDGETLFTRLEAVSDTILSRLAGHINPSTIDHFLVIIRPDKTGTVYINELEMKPLARSTRKIKPGEKILKIDILDVQRIKILNVHIPKDAGFVVLFSCGWRKGLFYDLLPLFSSGEPERDYDVEILLGQVWSYLHFQHLFKIEEPTWNEFFKQRWFPFIFLGYPLLKRMVEHVKLGLNVDELLPEIQTKLDTTLVENTFWERNPFFQSHIPLLECAIKRYQAKDYISTSAILYPRIEGIMHFYLTTTGTLKKYRSSFLTREILQKNEGGLHPCCFFLPEKFHEYLDNVYFPEFTPGSKPGPGPKMTHGEVRAENPGLKSSVIGFLILIQIALFLSAEGKVPEEEVGFNSI